MVTAYIDLEFGGVCGTWQRMKLPLEAGVVIHDPATDRVVFAERAFSFDIDVTIWKNVTDDLGRTVGKNPCTVNPAIHRSEEGHVRKVRFDAQERRRAGIVSRRVHEDLKNFLQGLNGFGIKEIVFFAADYEKTALSRAGINLSGFRVRDLQCEIKPAGKRVVLSLDRLSHIIGFCMGETEVSSIHFKYPVPEKYRTRMCPHDSLGDATRIFLAAQELASHPNDLRERVDAYVRLCGDEERKLAEEKARAEGQQLLSGEELTGSDSTAR